MIGLKTGTVMLMQHRTEWEDFAENTIRTMRNITGEVCTDIQHIGSTAVKSISAKPIVDIAAAVRDLEDILPYKDILAQNGIIYRKEEHNGQLLFIMGDLDNDIKTCHIHIVRQDSPNWQNYINFRDYLNSVPEKARQYETLKLSLAERFPHDRKAYTAGKAELIAELLREAEEWRRNNEE